MDYTEEKEIVRVIMLGVLSNTQNLSGTEPEGLEELYEQVFLTAQRLAKLQLKMEGKYYGV